MNNKTKTESWQRIKNYVVYAGLVIIFCFVIFWIIKPSKNDEKKEKGVNSTLPNPTKDVIIGDKIDAYEQDQLSKKQQERQNNLEEYQRLISGDGGNDVLYETAVESPTHSVATSATAYRDLHRTLGSFQETEKEDKEMDALNKRIADLQDQLSESTNIHNSMDEQVALMEKSYELASRYLPHNGGQPRNEVVRPTLNSNGKSTVTSVRHVSEPTVSSLVQRVSSNEFHEDSSMPRNVGFHSMGEEQEDRGRNTIEAIVYATQTITEGKGVRLRLCETVLVGDVCIPVNTIVTGFCKFSGERLDVIVSSIEYNGKLFMVDLTAYDADGQQGIYIPGSMERTSIKELAATVGGGLGSSINISQQKAGDQLLTDLGRGVIQGASQYIAKKVSKVKVTLKAGYKVLLLPKENH